MIMDGTFDQQEHLINCPTEVSASRIRQNLDPLQECMQLISLPIDSTDNSTSYLTITPMTSSDSDPNGNGQQTEESSSGATFTILDESMKELFYTDQGHNHGSRNQKDEDVSQDSCNTSSDSENLSKNYAGKLDPFSEACKIPLPGMMGVFGESRVFVRRRNERERARVRSVNDGFERLRSHLPQECDPKDRRLSKVETLRVAINYIKYLQELLSDD